MDFNKIQNISLLLDVNSRLPQPVSYRRIWWPAYRLGYGLTKGKPGYFVLFHDKHGNRFAAHRLFTHQDKISHLADLSKAFEEKEEF